VTNYAASGKLRQLVWFACGVICFDVEEARSLEKISKEEIK